MHPKIALTEHSGSVGAFSFQICLGHLQRKLGEVAMDLLLIFGVPLAAGFAAGYSFHAHISRRRRKLAQLHYPWP
jgi:hypothetical protein